MCVCVPVCRQKHDCFRGDSVFCVMSDSNASKDAYFIHIPFVIVFNMKLYLYTRSQSPQETIQMNVHASIFFLCHALPLTVHTLTPFR